MEITVKRLALILIVAFILVACEEDRGMGWTGDDPLHTDECEHNWDVTWDTGGYAPERGRIRAESVDYLSNGVKGIKTKDCGEFAVFAGEAVVSIREVR